MTYHRKRSWPAEIAAKILVGLAMLLLGGIFGAALLLQAVLSNQEPMDAQVRPPPTNAIPVSSSADLSDGSYRCEPPIPAIGYAT